jgi:hypothetical protein
MGGNVGAADVPELAATDDRLGPPGIRPIAPARMGSVVLVVQPAPVTKLIIEDLFEGAVSSQHHGGGWDALTPLRTKDAGEFHGGERISPERQTPPRPGPVRVLLWSTLLMVANSGAYALAPAWWVMVASGVLAGLGAGAIDAGMTAFATTHFTSPLNLAASLVRHRCHAGPAPDDGYPDIRARVTLGVCRNRRSARGDGGELFPHPPRYAADRGWRRPVENSIPRAATERRGAYAYQKAARGCGVTGYSSRMLRAFDAGRGP